MLSKIQAAIIDLDGTMIDTAPDFLVAINRMRADFQLSPLTLELIKTMVGKGSENLIHKVLAVDFDADGIAIHFDEALASYQRHYLVINGEHSQVYPQVMAGLQAMRDMGLRLVCVTNKPLAFALPLMQKKGLSTYFEQVYGGDSFAKKKPHPLPMLEACKALDLSPAQVLAIGDSSNDAIAARAAGCPVLTVPYGYNHGEAVQNIQSDGIVETLLDAARLLSAKNSL
ncbi:phosphoglycolate phosphatase [Undibacterium sp. TS12]|uniref:phosphoglycolate phosphatase n=1 Tax=Undibacterium sp. TS12 TaxID=2908202 RepID=UPI001F4CBF3C|nr:phosphoglycolate phosphatase [Undibacterium sp. TS12]MCH8623047.1 phosphoglycolate phosphatase [Undibacterium sp. TS12]